MVVHRRELGDVGFFPILGALICETLFFFFWAKTGAIALVFLLA